MTKPSILAEKQPWMKLRACGPSSAELFFGFSDEAVAAAKAICATCPVRERCLDYAIDIKERHGVWGGMTYDERRKQQRRRRTS